MTLKETAVGQTVKVKKLTGECNFNCHDQLSFFQLLCKSVSMSGIRMLHSAKVCQHYSFS